MKSILICATALALIGGPAFADEMVIHRDGPVPVPGDSVVTHRSGAEVETNKVIEHDGDGCDSKTVTKSNDMGDTQSKTVTRC